MLAEHSLDKVTDGAIELKGGIANVAQHSVGDLSTGETFSIVEVFDV